MGKVEEARQLLKNIGMPEKQQADLCCYVLLAMANIKEIDSWKVATNEWIRIHDIIQFVGANYGVVYAENSRETFRKQALHHFRTAALIEDNGKATNSPNYRYRLTEETLEMIRSIGGHKEECTIKCFVTYDEKLAEMYASKKKMTKMPVKINNEEFTFSAGKHNELQKAIIEKLKELGFEITLNDKMPDVVLYREDKDWIYFVKLFLLAHLLYCINVRSVCS